MIRAITHMEEIRDLSFDFIDHVEGMVGRFDIKWYFPVWDKLLDSDIGEVLVQEVDGEIVSAFGLITSHGTDGALEARELFWIVDRKRRGNGREMLDAAEVWCRERDVQRLAITRLEWSRGKSLDRLYRMAGYNPVERVFCKELI